MNRLCALMIDMLQVMSESLCREEQLTHHALAALQQAKSPESSFGTHCKCQLVALHDLYPRVGSSTCPLLPSVVAPVHQVKLPVLKLRKLDHLLPSAHASPHIIAV